MMSERKQERTPLLSNYSAMSDREFEPPPSAEKPAHVEKLTILQTSLALVATDIGGALLGLPYAFYRVGFINGCFALLFMAALSYFSNMMYLRVKNLTPYRYESIHEISYYLLGRPFVFTVNVIVLCTTIASMLLYYIILGETISHLWMQFFVGNADGRTHQEMHEALKEQAWWA